MPSISSNSVPSKRDEIDIQLRKRTINLTNKKFGYLLVLSFAYYKNTRPYWECVCDCGTKRQILSTSLVSGGTVSCGCYSRRINSIRCLTHGLTGTPTYRTWSGMVQRCTNPKSPVYDNYGGRGVLVCDRWLSFENFISDMGIRPSIKYTLDRINNDSGYSQNNCRWATIKEQNENKRNTIKLTIHGITAGINQWCSISGTKRQTIVTRYFREYSDEECVYGKNKSTIN